MLNLLQMAEFNHQVELTEGVLTEECSNMLSEFFRNLRVRKKQEKEERAKLEAETEKNSQQE